LTVAVSIVITIIHKNAHHRDTVCAISNLMCVVCVIRNLVVHVVCGLYLKTASGIKDFLGN
jgi:hypothetical protein